MVFYEAPHGGVMTDNVNVARHTDLLIGVVALINLEWIQKLQRDKLRAHIRTRLWSTRLPDDVNHICPQFSETHVNFQRVPIVDTSNPFIARDIPSTDESMLIIRFRYPRGIDFPYLFAMLHDSFMSRPDTIVCPGGKMALAPQLIFTPMLWKLMDEKRRV
jgi:phosphoribulokinase